MSKTTAENTADRTGGIEGRGVHLDLLGRLAGSRNDEALPDGDHFDVGGCGDHRSCGEHSLERKCPRRRGRVKEVRDQRLTR